MQLALEQRNHNKNIVPLFLFLWGEGQWNQGQIQMFFVSFLLIKTAKCWDLMGPRLWIGNNNMSHRVLKKHNATHTNKHNVTFQVG